MNKSIFEDMLHQHLITVGQNSSTKSEKRLKEVSVRSLKMCNVMDGFGKETWRVGICVLKGVSKIEF